MGKTSAWNETGTRNRTGTTRPRSTGTQQPCHPLFYPPNPTLYYIPLKLLEFTILYIFHTCSRVYNIYVCSIYFPCCIAFYFYLAQCSIMKRYKKQRSLKPDQRINNQPIQKCRIPGKYDNEQSCFNKPGRTILYRKTSWRYITNLAFRRVACIGDYYTIKSTKSITLLGSMKEKLRWERWYTDTSHYCP